MKKLVLALALLLAATPALACGDRVARTAVVPAFGPEGDAVLALVNAKRTCAIAGRRFTTGRIGKTPVVVFLSGVGMVNAAMTTQLAIDHFKVRRLVMSGIAGGADPALHIGDVAIPERWGQYLNASFARETPQGFRPVDFLETPHFANFGMIFPNGVKVASKKGEAAYAPRFWFEADARLLAAAREAAEGAELSACDASGACLAKPPRAVVGGAGLSGPVFVDNAAFRDYARTTFGAEVMDMESAALAQVAYANDLPFIAFRSVSDLAGGGEGENQMRTFMNLAATNSARFMQRFLSRLPD
jgi:adenosylhomocysteine nucleosidase